MYKEGVKHGQGALHLKNGVMIQGEWKDGDFLGGEVTKKNNRVDPINKLKQIITCVFNNGK